jgi:outer membrane lipoprotein SlyB
MKHIPLFTVPVQAFTIAALVTLGGCATSNPDVVRRDAAQRMAQVQDATVLSVRPVVIDGSQSGGGALAGAVAGGVAGQSVGGRREAAVVGMLGAVAGAVVGNAVERASTKEQAVEILFQLKNGERRSLIQAKGQETFEPGEAIILVTTEGKTRVMKAPK